MLMHSYFCLSALTIVACYGFGCSTTVVPDSDFLPDSKPLYSPSQLAKGRMVRRLDPTGMSDDRVTLAWDSPLGLDRYSAHTDGRWFENALRLLPWYKRHKEPTESGGDRLMMNARAYACCLHPAIVLVKMESYECPCGPRAVLDDLPHYLKPEALERLSRRDDVRRVHFGFVFASAGNDNMSSGGWQWCAVEVFPQKFQPLEFDGDGKARIHVEGFEPVVVRQLTGGWTVVPERK